MSPDVAESVRNILISHHELIENVEIDIPAGGALPPDGRWISEGILKKIEKYGGPEAVTELVLVIGVAGFVDDKQVRAFQTEHLGVSRAERIELLGQGENDMKVGDVKQVCSRAASQR